MKKKNNQILDLPHLKPYPLKPLPIFQPILPIAPGQSFEATLASFLILYSNPLEYHHGIFLQKIYPESDHCSASPLL